MAVAAGNSIGANAAKRSPQEEMEAFDSLGPHARLALATAMLEQSAYYLIDGAPSRGIRDVNANDYLLAQVVKNGDKFLVAATADRFWLTKGNPSVRPEWHHAMDETRRLMQQRTASDVIAEMRRARGQR